MNCPKCGEDWSDVAVVRNAKREALAPSDPAAPLREAAQAVVDAWDMDTAMSPLIDFLRAALATEEASDAQR